ncbi:ABC transporter ATP-binding protein [Bacillus sp. FJAT-44742]|uniref:ABC transporter ATP-binding protein n=1 Tax=Bacillus sp. FJAT-44742 TaxID=2014005 RepID=UPI000C2316DC|nr:ABC transporter ATP-binding protein [Bacillus sp. FJAT-44742]
MAQTSALSVKHLKVTIPEKNASFLHGVTFEIKKGRVLGLVGESGSGKTLTSLAILGLLPPSLHAQGSIRYAGKNLLTISQKEWQSIHGQEIASIFQNPMSAFDPIFTIGSQMVETIQSHQRISKSLAQEKAIKALQTFQLRDAEAIFHQFPFQLSGGMLQRVMIALIFVLKPSFLVADEPTTALDSVNQKIVLDELEKLSLETGMGMLLVTHDLSVLYRMAHEVIVLENGRIVEHASTQELFFRPQHPYTQKLLSSSRRIRGEFR